ncbi:hypothetical protein FRC09_012902 [Ceratobasidium sp. 395]|nr:hypothetical protein FRC09_012902 [Ceratobasidium sp. 395]
MKLPQDLKLIILMGATGSGKSTFINSVAGSALSVSTSLTSCTQQVAYVDLDLKDGTHLRLIDTPGFDDSTRADIEILEEIATALKIWGEDGLMIHGAIYLHRISDVRMSGSARKCLSTFLNICGNKAMQHVSIVTNMWGSVSHSEGEAREAELFQDSLFFKNALTAGAQTLRNDNPPHSAHEILLRAVRPTPVQLLIQKELIEDKKGILQTTAGVELDREMAEKRAQHEAELLELNQGYEYAQQQQDLETQEELEEEREILKKKIEGMKSMIERMQERKKIQARREHRHAPSPQYAGRSTATTRALNTEPSRAVVAEERSPWATNQMLAGPVALQSRHFPRDDLRSQYTFTEHSRPGNRGIEEILRKLIIRICGHRNIATIFPA